MAMIMISSGGSEIRFKRGNSMSSSLFIFPIDHVNRPISGGNVDIGRQRVEPSFMAGSESVIGTSTPASTSTFPPHPLASDMVTVPQDFL